ncbi:type II toxin-antitoxin system HicB family antitoxin [Lactobacillus sp. AN1001]
MKKYTVGVSVHSNKGEKPMFTKLMMAYPAIFRAEENGGYYIEFPDLEGVYTGISENDLPLGLEMASEVLGIMLSEFIQNGEKFNAPSPINMIKHKETEFVALVAVDVSQYFEKDKLVKKTLSIPKWVDERGKKWVLISLHY